VEIETRGEIIFLFIGAAVAFGAGIWTFMVCTSGPALNGDNNLLLQGHGWCVWSLCSCRLLRPSFDVYLDA